MVLGWVCLAWIIFVVGELAVLWTANFVLSFFRFWIEGFASFVFLLILFVLLHVLLVGTAILALSGRLPGTVSAPREPAVV